MVRLALAALLALQPVVQAAELSPVDILLTRAIPQDEAALATSGPEKGERLVILQSDLALVVEGLEGFASEADAGPSLKRLQESVDAPEQFKDRAAALDAVYRALAVVDYTWAKRLPEAPCSPDAARAALLKSGPLSSWIASLLGVDGDAAAALDRASAATKVSAREYALLRAKVRRLSEALSSEKAVGAVRASLYCRRAVAYEALSAANRSSGLTAASRATGDEDVTGVYVLARPSTTGWEILGAATSIDGAIVTDARLVESEGLALLGYDERKPIPVTVERRDSGLALLRAAEPVKGLSLAEGAPAKDDLIEALGHPERTGAWTRTRGLVTSADAHSFQSDAVVDVGMAGGAALTEDGKLAGVFVLRRAQTGDKAFDWPVAVSAPALRSWLAGGALTAPSGSVEIAEAGTASILTALRPMGGSTLASSNTVWINRNEFYQDGVRAVCAANCDDPAPAPAPRARSRTRYTNPRSSYGSSSNANAELGKALGEAVAPLVEAMIFKGIPALFRGIGTLFRSKPKTKPAQVAVAEERGEEPPPKPNPELTVTLTPASIVEGKHAHFLLTVTSNRDDVKTEGLSFNFTVEHDKEKKTGTAITDASGTAVLEVTPSPAARSFVELQKENVRHAGLINTARATNAEKICKLVLPGSMILGGLTASVVLARNPLGWVLIYKGGEQCLSKASGLIAGAGVFCTVEFGKQALAQRSQEPVPSYSPPIQAPGATKKIDPAIDAVKNRAESAFGAVDDHAQQSETPADMEVVNIDEGGTGNPSVPPEEPEEEKAELDLTKRHKHSGKKVADILSEKKASIKNAPLEKGSPSWKEFAEMTWEQILAGARARKPGFKMVRKLLTDSRFNKQ